MKSLSISGDGAKFNKMVKYVVVAAAIWNTSDCTYYWSSYDLVGWAVWISFLLWITKTSQRQTVHKSKLDNDVVVGVIIELAISTMRKTKTIRIHLHLHSHIFYTKHGTSASLQRLIMSCIIWNVRFPCRVENKWRIHRKCTLSTEYYLLCHWIRCVNGH